MCRSIQLGGLLGPTRLGFEFAAKLMVAVTLFSTLVGCDETPTPKPVSVNRSPEVVFDEIVESVKEAMESTERRGMIVFDAETRSRGTVRYAVTGRLVPPPDKATPLRGEVNIVVRSHFVAGEPPQPEQEEPAPVEEFDLPEGVELAEGVDPELFARMPREKDKPTIHTGQRSHEVRKETSYLLEYRNEEWQLVSELDPDVESALQMAFDRALARQ